MRAEYVKVKNLCRVDCKSLAVGEAILEFVTVSLEFLIDQCRPVDLVSRVSGKHYFTYSKDGIVARPANISLFLADPNVVSDLWNHWLDDTISPQDFARLSYTVALTPCLAMELFDKQNKKGPATYFECYIGHLFAKSLNTNPTKRARLPVHGRDVLMTMDYLFDVESMSHKVHIPVKMSTRERVVQGWAHQRLLDAAYGEGTFRGIMVLFSETKLDSRSLEVVEICVPDQWLVYQTLLAKMDRIYYFDIPARYKGLANDYPDVISIKPFGEFFTEREAVLREGPLVESD